MHKIAITITLLSGLWMGCGGNGSEPECPHGKPRPLFKKEMPGVSNYSFEAKGNNSTEKLSVPEIACDLELLESGCEDKTQEIRLTLHAVEGQLETVNTPSDCAQLFGSGLLNISELAPQELLSLKQWGIAVAQQHERIQYNTPISLENEPFVIQMDKMQQPDAILITVVIKSADKG